MLQKHVYFIYFVDVSDVTHNVECFAVVFLVLQSFVIEIIHHFSFTAGLQKTHVVRHTCKH